MTGTICDPRLAAEIAVAVYIQGRDWEALKTDLANLLVRRPTAAEVSALLWPPRSRHFVTALVSGARSLDNLDDFLPGAQQWRVSGSQNEWPKSKALVALLLALEPITRSSVLVRVPVDSADLGTAVVLGRRAITETLDQYVAGNRIADLTLGSTWQVTGPDGKWALRRLERASVTNAAPLQGSPTSEILRPAMRIAHIAQRVEAPMTSTALCWSALESIGLKSDKSVRLAKAYALQALRLQIIDARTQLRLMVMEELRRIEARAKKAKGDLIRAENALRARTPLARTTPAQIVAMVAAVAHARESWLACQATRGHAFNKATTLIEIIDVHVPAAAPRPNLTSPDRWLDLLLPPCEGEAPEVDTARRAVTTLADFAGGAAAETILMWRDRLAQPPLLAKWLQEKQDTCLALLDWLYVTRNIAFHDGRFAGPIDVATAHAGRAIVDVMLEILGRWHSTQQRRGQDLTSPEEILNLLAQRKDDLSARLGVEAACHRLSIQHISGPDEYYWSAVR
ncbi:hypothetical protein AB0N89_20360 [Amycolatopsis sp. NPDC089917]|uniref:hypothetical protein n=1 Tax=Amycolatopsis sp. NPDC089917 TaxID=3155187 RepID=UPI0034225759